MARPHLIERMENLISALDEASENLDGSNIGANLHDVEPAIDNARGIAGEVLTMIDGR
jgi:hypothetical protein